jgi:hypothetical protein
VPELKLDTLVPFFTMTSVEHDKSEDMMDRVMAATNEAILMLFQPVHLLHSLS